MKRAVLVWPGLLTLSLLVLLVLLVVLPSRPQLVRWPHERAASAPFTPTTTFLHTKEPPTSISVHASPSASHSFQHPHKFSSTLSPLLPSLPSLLAGPFSSTGNNMFSHDPKRKTLQNGVLPLRHHPRCLRPRKQCRIIHHPLRRRLAHLRRRHRLRCIRTAGVGRTAAAAVVVAVEYGHVSASYTCQACLVLRMGITYGGS